MPFTKLRFRPGVDREGTDYENTQGWYDSDKVRFRKGMPEKIGGWEPYSNLTFLGTCRKLYPWTSLEGTNRIGLGTHVKLYMEVGLVYNDITPIRRTVTLGTDPVNTTSGSAVITFDDTGHGAAIGDYVTISGSTAVNGIPADEINAEHVIESVPDDDSWTVTVTTSASSTGTGGGASVQAEYQISVGLDTTVFGTGWGVGAWGSDAWGEESDSSASTAQLRLWSMVTFGEDLLANVRNSGIYYWDTSTSKAPIARAVNITSLAGSNGAPTICRQILLAPENRHLIALACDPSDDVGNQDSLLIRWADAESLTDWVPDTTNSAGGTRLNVGSQIIGGITTKSTNLIWTDNSLHSLTYIGAPFFFGVALISSNTSLISPNAAIEVDEVTYWMGKNNFYAYAGTVRVLDSTLEDYVFDRVNTNQAEKIFVGVNRGESEVTWWYPSTTDEVDSYITYNYLQNIWYGGSLIRTAWVDRESNDYPLAAATDGRLYDHEKGWDNGENNPATGITAYIESSAFEAFPGDGYRFAFVDRIIPDITFDGSTEANPSVTMSITPRDYPGVAPHTGDDTSVIQSASTPIELYTREASIRVRGRSLVYRVESSGTGVAWRDGTPRLQIRPDGRQ